MPTLVYKPDKRAAKLAQLRAAAFAAGRERWKDFELACLIRAAHKVPVNRRKLAADLLNALTNAKED